MKLVLLILAFWLSLGLAFQNLQPKLESLGASYHLDQTRGVANVLYNIPKESQEKWQDFLVSKGHFFGLHEDSKKRSDVNEEMFLASRTKASQSPSMEEYHLRVHQYAKGLRVFGAELKLIVDNEDFVQSVAGAVVPNVDILDVTPRISEDEAKEICLLWIRTNKDYQALADIQIDFSVELVIYRDGFFQEGKRGHDHLTYFITAVSFQKPFRHFFFVDASSSRILLEYSGIQNINRILYVGNVNTNPVWREGNTLPTNADQLAEVLVTGQSYNFYASITGGTFLFPGDMIIVHNPNDYDCRNLNAFWDGTKIKVCPGLATDDIIAHEWGHAYTQFTSGLIYRFDAGALNEGYSDIWGETIDLMNGFGLDNPSTRRTDNLCSFFTNSTAFPSGDQSYRWLMGEGSGFGYPIRDMWKPECNSDPGSTFSDRLYCGFYDNAGVHSNSGIANRIYSLLVDGGVYNSYTVAGLGFTKAIHIFWRTQFTKMTPRTSFFAWADYLEASCQELIGQVLFNATLSPTGWGVNSGAVITTNDCNQVSNAIIATGLRRVNPCNYSTLLDTSATSSCSLNSTVSSIFSENFDSGLGSWTSSSNTGKRGWISSGTLPFGRLGKAAFGTTSTTATDPTEVSYLTSPSIFVQNQNANRLILSFDHSFALFKSFFGGIIQINVNNGGWQTISSSAFIKNRYNGYLPTQAPIQQNSALTLFTLTNPLRGNFGFTGEENGADTSQWATSQILLNNLVPSGSNIQIRFALGTDDTPAPGGWFIDNVKLYLCLGECTQTYPSENVVSTRDLGTSVTGLTLGSWVQNNGYIYLPLGTYSNYMPLYSPIPTGSKSVEFTMWHHFDSYCFVGISFWDGNTRLQFTDFTLQIGPILSFNTLRFPIPTAAQTATTPKVSIEAGGGCDYYAVVLKNLNFYSNSTPESVTSCQTSLPASTTGVPSTTGGNNNNNNNPPNNISSASRFLISCLSFMIAFVLSFI